MKDFLHDSEDMEIIEEDDFPIDESDSHDVDDGEWDDSGEEDDRCDLDPSKKCDNCFKCLDSNIPDYEEIKIGEIIMDMDEHAFDFADTPFKYQK